MFCKSRAKLQLFRHQNSKADEKLRVNATVYTYGIAVYTIAHCMNSSEPEFSLAFDKYEH